MGGAARLYDDYFSPAPVYSDDSVKRFFVLSRRFFGRIYEAMTNNPYFIQRRDCTGLLGLSGYQKATAAIRILAYGCASDAVDEYICLSLSTADDCVRAFVRTVNSTFQAECLRAPNEAGLKRLLQRGNHRAFLGMFGSLDFCKWIWNNCPKAWHGQLKGKEQVPAITLEEIAADRFWIRDAYFGMSGSCNDIYVLDNYPLLSNVAQGT